MKPTCLGSALVLSLALLVGCGTGGDGTGGGGTSATADVLLSDAPVDDLLSFAAQVESVRLRLDDGSFTGDLVDSLRVEFLSLNGGLVFLSRDLLPSGTYDAVEVTFAAGQYEAQDLSGAPVTVVAGSNTLLALLAAPLTIGAGEYVRFTVDLDLATSLTGDVSSGSVDFDPSGSSDSNDGSEDAEIDELRGTVVSASFAARTVLMDGTVGDPPLSVGRVNVHVPDTAVLLDSNDQTLNLDNFFNAADAGTLLEVHGALGAGGAIEATRIEIEDAGGGGEVRIAGVAMNVTAGAFDLLIAEIKDGADVADPVLAGLGDPASIQVSFGGSTSFTFDSGGITDSSALADNQEVRVRFSAFSTEPFPASEVEIDDTPGFHGTLTGFGPLLSELYVRLDPSDPAILGGSVASADTPVRVLFGGAPFVLAVPARPGVSAAELAVGLELEPRGRLSGPPSAPVIDADRVLVRPGFLRAADLTHVAAGGGNFVVDGGAFVDPFGQGVTPGPLQVWIEEGCQFEGAVHSGEEFQALFGGQVMLPATVDVRGLGNGHPNEIRAFVVRVEER